jgi:hypothetical protein
MMVRSIVLALTYVLLAATLINVAHLVWLWWQYVVLAIYVLWWAT